MDQNVTTMDDTVEELSINSAKTINRLAQLITESRWDLVLAHLQTIQGLEEARTLYSTTDFNKYDFYDYAPCHVIEAFAKAYPEGVLQPNIVRDIIHTANEETANMVCKLFFETNPKCSNDCAVELFYEAFRICDTEVLELMIRDNAKLLYKKDSSNGLPIHIACSMDECEKIDLLLDCDASQAKLVVEDLKMFPLHLACRPYCDVFIFNMKTFRRLIKAYPQAAKKKDAQGRLPLHYACGGVSYRTDRPDNHDFVSELLNEYPKAAQIRDKRKNLPLHYLFMPEQSVQCDQIGHEETFWLDFQAGYLQGIDHRRIEKELILLIRKFPDALLQADGVEDRLVLERLAVLQYPSRQVWHTAGSLCSNAFICASQQSMQPLYHVSLDLRALVQNFLETPMDLTKMEGDMQDGELVGIILHYTFEALIQAKKGLDIKTMSNHVPLFHQLVMHYKSLNNQNVTGNTTLLHKLAYCSKFCDPRHLMHLFMAMELHTLKQCSHFLLPDQNGNLPLHLVCCAPPPLILSEVYNRRTSETTYVGLVETFLTPCKKAAQEKNHFGKTPLDILMETKSELSKFNIESWQGVELLVISNPKEANKLFTKEKLYPFMLSAIGKQANLSCTFAMLLIFVSIQNLDDLGSRIFVKNMKRPRYSN